MAKNAAERRNGGRVTIARPALWGVGAALGTMAAVSLVGRLVVAQVPTTDGSSGTVDQRGLDGGVPTTASEVLPATLGPADDASSPPFPDAIDGGHAVGLPAGPGVDADESRSGPPPSAISAVSARPTSTSLPVAVASERAGVAVGDGLGHYGLNADVGFSGLLPDLGLLLALRPMRWLHVQAGGGYNATAFGVRGGLTVRNPFLLPLSLTCEGGHYFAGDANKVVHWFSSNARDVASLRRFSYDYLNLLGGLDFAGQHFALYLRGGVTWMRTTIADFAQSVHDLGHVDLQASDPRVSYRGPTFKLGMYYFF